jgi:DNA-binding CsgD family transcriptional regulator
MSVARSPLVGRSDELALVGQALDAALAGDPTFILVLGEAGIGKTAFLRATAWLAAARGLRVLQGTAIPSGASIPYLPLIGPLRSAASDTTQSAPGMALLTAFLEGEAGDTGIPDAARAARVLESIYDVVTGRPTLLVIDDAHWADAATLTVLDYLAHRAAEDQVMVLVAARDDEPAALRAIPIADGRRYLQLKLLRLSRAAVREQAALLSGAEMTEAVVDALFERSAGNPLYVEELMAEMRADAASTIETVAVPPSLRSLVLRRVEQLAPPARQASQALAVLGSGARLTLVAAVAGLDVSEAADALAAAERGGVTVRRADAHALRHPLFGEALLAELRAGERSASLHRRAAEALEAAGASAGELALHWEAAGDERRTWASSLTAGSEAEATGAFFEARTHFERALAHWPSNAEEPGPTLLRAGYAAWMTGDPDDALLLAQRGAREGAPYLDAELAIGQFAWDAGQREYATDAFVRASTQLTDESPHSTRSRALWGLGRARVGQGAHDDAYRLGMEAAHVASGAGDDKWVSQGLVLAGMARAWNDDIGGISELERGLEAAIRSDDPEAVGHAYQFLTGLLWNAGRLQEAARVGMEGIPVCDRLGLARSHGNDLRGETALALIDLGEWVEADALLDDAERAKPLMSRGLLAARRGDWEAAERDLAAAANGLSIGGRGRLGGLRELALAEMHWLRGDDGAARAELDAIPQQPGIWGTDMDIRTALWRTRLGQPPGDVVRHYDAEFEAAVAAELLARRDGQPDAWLAAAAGWNRCARPFERTLALLGAAEAAYAAGNRQAGRDWLEAAIGEARRLGAAPLVDRAEHLARRARVRLVAPVARDGDVSQLTRREIEVLQLLAEGRTNPQIAQHLFISPKTVGIHVQRVLEKLDAHTRGEAVAQARRRGILP